MKKKIVVILDNIRSRENVGSIFRTADAAGVAKIYLCGITPVPSASGGATGQAPQHDKIAKTALGAEKWVPREYYKQTWRLIEKFKKEGYLVVALENTKKAENIFKFSTKDRQLVALIVGNEVVGLSPQILKRAKKIVAIPMYGHKESLNVAVAFGIAVYALNK